MFIILITKVCVYFALGVKLYNYLASKDLRLLNYLKKNYNFDLLKLTFIEYFLIYFFLILTIKIISNFLILQLFE